MSEDKRVPALRFKDFIDPWEQRKLGKIVKVGSGRDYKHLGKGNIPVYGTGGYMLSVDKALSEKKDAIGIGRKGTIDKPCLLKAPFWTVDTLFYCIPEKNYHLQFSLQIFNRIDWKQKDESTGVPSLSNEAINNVEIKAPVFSEQARIGAFFQRLDSLITLHQRKCDKLTVLKKSMLEKMFPKPGSDVPELRFAGFTDPWEQRKLGEITYRYKEMIATPKNGYWRLGVRSHAKGTFLSFVPAGMQLGEKELCKVVSGALIVNIVFAWEHAIAITGQTDVKALVSHRFPQYSFNDDMAPGFFKYAVLDARFKHHLWLSSPSGAGRNKTLSTDEMLKYKFVFPKKHEQEQIAALLDTLDSLITLHQRELDLLKNVKRSLLEKMFI